MTLTDEQWQLVESILSNPLGLTPIFYYPNRPPPRRRGRGRPVSDQRLVMDAVLAKLASDVPWRQLPTTNPSWQTCSHAYKRWKQDGTLHRVLTALYRDLILRGGFDFQRALSEKQVRLDLRPGRQRIYIATTAPRTWQLVTATLFFQHFIEAYDWRKRPHSPPGPLAEILGIQKLEL